MTTAPTPHPYTAEHLAEQYNQTVALINTEETRAATLRTIRAKLAAVEADHDLDPERKAEETAKLRAGIKYATDAYNDAVAKAGKAVKLYNNAQAAAMREPEPAAARRRYLVEERPKLAAAIAADALDLRAKVAELSRLDGLAARSLDAEQASRGRQSANAAEQSPAAAHLGPLAALADDAHRWPTPILRTVAVEQLNPDTEELTAWQLSAEEVGPANVEAVRAFMSNAPARGNAWAAGAPMPQPKKRTRRTFAPGDSVAPPAPRQTPRRDTDRANGRGQ